jgi:cysteine desulfurase/selenocysteine lyase
LNLKKGDIVLTTDKEHNSNLIPWILQKQTKGINHQIIFSNKDNTFNIETFEQMINKNVKLISLAHTSNLDGYTIPAQEIIKIAHDYGALVLLDGAQSAPHKTIDVQKLDADFFAFSFHKLLGPTGIAALYGKYHLLEDLSPFIVGGNTVQSSTYDSFELSKPPEKFEAGLQNYAGIIGAGTALDFIKKIGINNITHHIYKLNKYITKTVSKIPGLQIIGPLDPNLRTGIINFTIENKEPHTIALTLNEENIMVRSGVFCLHSWFNAHKIKGSVRASLYLYNTEEECKTFINILENT